LEPARAIILNHLATRKGGIILQMFSMGGAQCATLLTMSLPPEVRLKAWGAVVMDSCPGITTYGRSVKAMLLSLPSPPTWLRAVAIPFVHLLFMFIMVRAIVFRREDLVTKARKRLNDANLFSTQVPRLYLWSKEDVMVDWKAVLSHVSEAQGMGWQGVQKVEFAGSPHCAHAMMFPERYWSLVPGFVDTRKECN
jgi:hypothetical protein